MSAIEPGSMWSGIRYQPRGRRWLVAVRHPAISSHTHGTVWVARRFWRRSNAQWWLDSHYEASVKRDADRLSIGLLPANLTYQLLNYEEHPHAPQMTNSPAST